MTLALEMAAMAPEMSEKRRTPHSSVTVSRSASFGTPPQRILAAVLQNQGDCIRKGLARLLLRLSLAVRPGDLRAARDVPVTLAFKDGCKFVLHVRVILYTSPGSIVMCGAASDADADFRA